MDHIWLTGCCLLTRGFYIPAKMDGLNYGSDFVPPLSGVPSSVAPHYPKDKELILWLSHLLFHTRSPASLSSLLSFRPSPRCNPMNDSSYPLTLPLFGSCLTLCPQDSGRFLLNSQTFTQVSLSFMVPPAVFPGEWIATRVSCGLRSYLLN